MYVQPIAQHRRFPEHLLVRGGDELFYVWLGAVNGSALEEIEASTAAWLLRTGLVAALGCEMWFHTDDLPIDPHRAPTPLES
jgi:hypothetical protein